MTAEQLTEVPPKYLGALGRLREQFHRVEPAFYDEQGLQITLWRDKDTVNPSYYMVVEKDGKMYRKELRRNSLWPVDPPERSAWEAFREGTEHVKESTKRVRPRRPSCEVQVINTSPTLQSMFVKRAEVVDDLHRYEDKFCKDPNDLNASVIRALRERLNEIEDEIIAVAEAHAQ